MPAAERLAEVYARITEALRADDGVYHAVVAQERDGMSVAGETWVDIGAGTGRAVLGGVAMVVDGDLAYRAGFGGGTGPPAERIGRPMPSCYGAPPVVTLVLDCALVFHANESLAVADVVVDGRALVAIASQGGALGAGSWLAEPQGSYQRTVFLDATTYLPVRIEAVARLYEPVGITSTAITRVRSERVGRDTIPAGFYDPEAIGVVPYDPLAEVQAAAVTRPIVWFGPTVAAAGTRPALVLVFADGDDEDFRLVYAPADDRYGMRSIELVEVATDGPQAGGGLPSPACPDREAPAVRGARSVMVTCPEPAAWPFAVARVTYADLEVTLHDVGACGAACAVTPTFDDLTALLRLLVRA